MRINLITPFAEKEAVKALGARWDSAKKTWYIVDVADLTPFSRWITTLDVTTESSNVGRDTPKQNKASSPSNPMIEVPHCGCDVRPWEDCVHTANT